jgi:hypothetical protein
MRSFWVGIVHLVLETLKWSRLLEFFSYIPQQVYQLFKGII